MGYRSLEESTKNHETQELTWKSLLKRQGFLGKSKWVSLRKTKFANNFAGERYHKNTIAYNLLRDKYDLLNEPAANYLSYFISPREINTCLKELGSNSDTNLELDLTRFVISLLKENLIEIEGGETHGCS
jgi:hypothetical protein